MDRKKCIQPSSRPILGWDALYYRNRVLLQINKMQLFELEFDQEIPLKNFSFKNITILRLNILQKVLGMGLAFFPLHLF